MLILAIGDLHCGHRLGLTPPAWRVSAGRDERQHAMQTEMWTRFRELVRAAKPDLLLANGDLIDGRGERSGGVELITGDRSEQADIAVRCLKECRARHIVITRGTPYHTGTEEDFEDLIAARLGAQIVDHAHIDADGVLLDARHHVGGSGVPHGRHTAMARERLWAELGVAAGTRDRATVYLRSHVHYHAYCGGPGWLGMTLPALQAGGTKYGARRCTGEVHWGVVWVEVQNGRVVGWRAETVQLAAAKSQPLRF